MEPLVEYLDTGVRCAVCRLKIRRRQPARNVPAGWAHPACADSPDDHRPAVELEPLSKVGPRPNPRNDPAYRARRAEVFDEARRYYGWACHWCGRETSEQLPREHPLKAVADHVIAVARDPDHLSLVIACRECNRDRSDKPGRPPWLRQWTPGTPLPMSPTERRARARARPRGRSRPWLRDEWT